MMTDKELLARLRSWDAGFAAAFAWMPFPDEIYPDETDKYRETALTTFTSDYKKVCAAWNQLRKDLKECEIRVLNVAEHEGRPRK